MGTSGCDRFRTRRRRLRAVRAKERVHTDQASHAAARRLIPPTSCPCSLAPSVTTPLYSTTVSQALRQTLRRQPCGPRGRTFEDTSPSRLVEGTSAGEAPVRLELGTERCGEDLAQRPISARPWHEEVGLGEVEHDERDGADLDYIVPVQCDLREDPRRGLFRPGLVEEEVADAVEDRLALVHLDPLGPVGVAPDYQVRPGVYRSVRAIHLSRLGGREVFFAPVRHHDDEVHLPSQPCYIFLHYVLK